MKYILSFILVFSVGLFAEDSEFKMNQRVMR
ncbi:MAG: hypothetical protein CM1200mP12_13180 [Gammaproteobacteria bacterium]|nr:MAG: hypothetical protein CM1200mP12_13180 [Gammaproteobacteria bacterium]